MGCNEETGSKCMEHYNEVAEELSCGFTPDANFPCIHGEKGHMSMMAYSKKTKILSMNGGFVSNAVCDTCTTVIPASKLGTEGKAGSCFFRDWTPGVQSHRRKW